MKNWRKVLVALVCVLMVLPSGAALTGAEETERVFGTYNVEGAAASIGSQILTINVENPDAAGTWLRADETYSSGWARAAFLFDTDPWCKYNVSLDPDNSDPQYIPENVPPDFEYGWETQNIIDLYSLYYVDGIIFSTGNGWESDLSNTPDHWEVTGSADLKSWETIASGDASFFDVEVDNEHIVYERDGETSPDLFYDNSRLYPLGVSECGPYRYICLHMYTDTPHDYQMGELYICSAGEYTKGYDTLAEAADAINSVPVSGYEFVEGSEGIGNEGPANLWDGTVYSKFCQINDQDPENLYMKSTARVEEGYKVNGVILATANDNRECQGRLPDRWVISGSADNGETWKEILSGDASFFDVPARNYTYYSAAVEETDAFQMFRLEMWGPTADGVVQLSECVLCSASAEYIKPKEYHFTEDVIEIPENERAGLPALADAPDGVEIESKLFEQYPGQAEYDDESGEIIAHREGRTVVIFKCSDGGTASLIVDVRRNMWTNNTGLFTVLNGNLYELHIGNLRYEDAQKFAAEHGGRLLMVSKDNGESQFIVEDLVGTYAELNGDSDGFWLGSCEGLDGREESGENEVPVYVLRGGEEGQSEWGYDLRDENDYYGFILEFENWEADAQATKTVGENGHEYYIYRSGLNWVSVNNLIHNEMKGHLAAITDQAENDLVAGMNTEDLNLWIGAVRGPDGWLWESGEEWGYTNWHDGEPSGEERARYSPDKWDDIWEDPWDTHGFILEVEPQIPRGDVNGDGYVDSDDAIYLLRHVMNASRYPINQPGDMNGDGYKDSDDAIYLLRHVMNKTRYPLYEETGTPEEPGKTYLPTDGAAVEHFPGDGLYVDYAVNYAPAGYVRGGTRAQLSGGNRTVKAVPNLGYRFVRWSDGRTNPVRTDSADTISESTVFTAIFDYDILDMPIIAIDTETAEDVKSKTEYINADLCIMGTEEEYELSETVLIRGRGNNTWSYDKKSYKMKFPEKVNLFGLGTGKDKVWVLLANVCDQSLQRNHVSMELARSLDGVVFSPASLSVEVYLNGEYRGVYLLAEEIKDSKARVNIDTKGYETSADIGYLVELSAYADHDDFWVDDRKYQVHNDLSEDEEVYGQQITFIRGYIEQCWEAVKGGDRETIGSLMDIDSMVDTYLAEEVVKNLDVGWDSYYLYKEKGGKLFFGPLWDFDLALGNANEGEETIDGLFAATHSGSGGGNPWYYTAMEYEWFRELVVERWDEVKADILDRIPGQIRAEGSSKLRSYERNFDRWQIFGTCQNRETEAIMRLKNYTEHYEYLADWLSQRIDWLDEIYHNENFLTMELESVRPTPGAAFIDPETETLFQSLTDLTEAVDTDAIETTSPGFKGEGVENLFDGEAGTKYCWSCGGETEILFRTKEAVAATHYAFMTANDTKDCPERNPEKWRIYGSADGESWDLIAAKDDGQQVMAKENYTWSVFAFDHPSAYEYYKAVLLSGSEILQLSEMTLLK